jgi:hypothetical protein
MYVCFDEYILGIYIYWTNLVDLTKSTRFNPKNQLGSDNWVGMGFKNEKPIQKIGFRVKPDSTQNTH